MLCAQRAWCLFVHSYAHLGASLLHLGSSRGCRQRGGAADGGFAVLVCWGWKQAGCSNPTSRGGACLCTAAAVSLRLCVRVCRVLISSLHGWACEFLWLVLSAGMCEFRAGMATLHQLQLCRGRACVGLGQGRQPYISGSSAEGGHMWGRGRGAYSSCSFGLTARVCWPNAIPTVTVCCTQWSEAMHMV